MRAPRPRGDRDHGKPRHAPEACGVATIEGRMARGAGSAPRTKVARKTLVLSRWWSHPERPPAGTVRSHWLVRLIRGGSDMNRRWGASVLALLLVLGSSCGKQLLPTQPASDVAARDPVQALRVSRTSDAAQIIGSTRSGAQFALYRPDRWNGALVLYAHGYTAPGEPIHLPPIDNLRDQLLGMGFGVAYSSFSENGLAIKDGIRQTERVEELFADRLGRPRRTFLIGTSMGGVIAVALAEDGPEHYDGLLTVSGLIGGTRGLVDYIAHIRVLFDLYYPGVLPGRLHHV